MQLRMQLAITAVLAAVLGGGWLYWNDAKIGARSQEPARKRTAAVAVLIDPAEAADDKVVVRAIGTGEARRSATIHAATAGEVVKIGFEPEQRVAKGDVLLRLDNKHQRLAVRLAEVAVKEASRQLRRLEKLAPKGAASVARLETAQTNLESANLRLDQARADLRDRAVYAPFDGVIGLTAIDVGDRITAETPIATLDDRAFIDVAFNLPEEYAPKIGIGSLVTVRPRTMRERTIEGTISATGSRIDPVTRSLTVKAEIPNANDALRPGTSFEVRVDFVGRSYPSVREVAVLWSRDGAYVWRVKDDRAQKVFVKIVRRDGGRILLRGALKVGDHVVVEGVQGLRQGQRVAPKLYSAEKVSAVIEPQVGRRS